MFTHENLVHFCDAIPFSALVSMWGHLWPLKGEPSMCKQCLLEELL